ncbi:NlpC/P60 family protein [Nocardiopsis alba]|uniref:C40 family peptidase n=1 Tax=Nocardiopsis alba TaxID=53437 RepID=UPI0035D932E6
MQFIPSSWEIYQQDGNDDGTMDPNNVYDATLGAEAHLCDGAGQALNLTVEEDLRSALFLYNRSSVYGENVMAMAETYESLSLSAERSGFSGNGDPIIAAAEQWLDTPYKFGGDCNTLGQDLCDCSSLTRYAYRHGADLELPRTTYEQVQLPQNDDRFVKVPFNDLRPGDLLFFGGSPPWGIGHVGIYISES